MKEKNNIEQFDSLFKQQLENASVQPPSGLFESMSSSIGHTAATTKVTLLSKLLLSTVIVSTTAIISYFSFADSKTSNSLEKEVTKNTNTIELTDKTNISTPNNTESQNNIDDKTVINERKKTPSKVVKPLNTNPFNVPVEKDLNTNLSESFPIITGDVNTINNEINKTTNKIEPEIIEQLEPAHVANIDSSYIFIPNAVTPNGDGLNDEYLIDIKGEERVQIIIFDKNSNRLFETKNKSISWKCTLPNGEIAPDGDYIVKVIYTFKNKEQQTKTIKLKLIK